MKRTKAGHGELERNDPEVKILGGTEQEGSGKTAVQHMTQKISKNVGGSMKTQRSQLWLLLSCSLLRYTQIFCVVLPQQRKV